MSIKLKGSRVPGTTAGDGDVSQTMWELISPESPEAQPHGLWGRFLSAVAWMTLTFSMQSDWDPGLSYNIDQHRLPHPLAE